MLPLSPLTDMRGMVRQTGVTAGLTGFNGGGSTLTSEDKNSQIYTLLSTGQQEQQQQMPQQPAYMELGVLFLVPVVLWCLLSWALSYMGSTAFLVKFELFAFVPAAAAAFACERIRHLRSLPAQLTCLKEENEWFKSSNAELKQGVDLLRAENEEARTANMKLQSNIQGLESVRSAIETYASRHETDFGHVLGEFQKSVAEQQSILNRTRQIQRRTRRLAEAQWRALMLNLYQQVERYAEGRRGMNRKGFDMWLAMLPTEISERLGPETFESIDTNGDGIVEVKEMCQWVQYAVKTLLRVDQGDSDNSDESEEDTTAVTDTTSIFANPFGSALRAHNVQGLLNPFGPSASPVRRGSKDAHKTGSRGSSRASESRASESRASEEEEVSEVTVPLPGTFSQSPREQRSGGTGINFASDGLKLFSTRPPVTAPGAGSPGSAGAGSPGAGSPGTGSLGTGAGVGSPSSAPDLQRPSRRDLSVPGKGQGTSRPSFNEGYMQKLFGGSANSTPMRRSSTDGSTPPMGQRAASSPGSVKNTGGSSSRARTPNSDVP